MPSVGEPCRCRDTLAVCASFSDMQHAACGAGMKECGLPAGVVVHVTKFFTAAEVQRALSFTLTALSISQVTNSPALSPSDLVVQPSSASCIIFDLGGAMIPEPSSPALLLQVLGAPIGAGLIMMDGLRGIRGWRWVVALHLQFV